MTIQDQDISPWVERFSKEIPKDCGPVLDLACGSGRHARFLRRQGFQVIAIDRDDSAFASLNLQGIWCVNCDLETSDLGYVWPFVERSFAAVIVTNYLHRPLMASILSSLVKGGVLIYETFAVGNEALGRPRNPQFLLRENELLEACMLEPKRGIKFKCLGFEHGFVNRNGPAIVQSICVKRV